MPDNPGSFRIQGLWLAQKGGDGSITVCMPLPADVLKLKNGVHSLRPQTLPAGLSSSANTSRHAVLRARAEKPEGGQWLNAAGIAAWLRGEPIDAGKHLLYSGDLWKTDHRLGIALDAQLRTAEGGRLYTTETIALKEGTGFIVGIHNADALPATGQLRLGGDGRAAAMSTPAFTLPEPDWAHIEKHKHFRLVLATPGLFPRGWQLPGAEGETIRIGSHAANMACAAVSRHDVISGWDLAKWQPKNAERITPAGSVYWLENYSGDIASLQTLIQNGIGMDTLNSSRRAEGFNNIMIANWI